MESKNRGKIIDYLKAVKAKAREAELMRGIIDVPQQKVGEIINNIENSNKVIQLTRNNNKKAGYVDALVLSFIVASFAAITMLLMMVRINMSVF